MKEAKKYWGAFVLGLSVFCLAKVNRVEAAPKTVRQGIYIDGVDVSGATKEEATSLVEQRVEQNKDYKIHLKVGDEFVTVSGEELGIYWKNTDLIAQALNYGKEGNIVQRYKKVKQLKENSASLSVKYGVDEDALHKVISDYCASLNKNPVNPTLIRVDGNFSVEDGKNGMTLNEEESYQLLKNFVENEWKGGDATLDLSYVTTEPAHKKEELTGVVDVLGSSSTDYSSSSSSRKQNIQTGASKVNGKVIYPGEQFSFTQAVVPFNAENGYATAPSYESGEVVDSYGGGICQVSTTLYLALLRSEVQIDERHSHSMLVSYVKPSMDATIAEGSKDFVFTNTTGNPIYLESYTDGSTIGFNVYGVEYRDRQNREVSFESVTTDTEEPTTQLKAAPEESAGTITLESAAHEGREAELYKIVTVNGQESREKVNSSSYIMKPNVYKVGVQSDNTDTVNKLYTAIEKNDLNAAYAAVQ